MRLPSLLNSFNYDLANFDKEFNSFFVPYEVHSLGPKWETEGNQLSIQFDMPGLKKENIKVNIENKELIISGIRQVKSDQKFSKKTYSYRTWLPDEANRETLQAKFEDGVLTLTCEKEKSAQMTQIEVK